MSFKNHFQPIYKKMLLVFLSLTTIFIITSCSYYGHLELRGEVVNIKLIRYDNPDVGFARNLFGLAIGLGRYQNFDHSLVYVFEELDESQFKDFLSATYDKSFHGHFAGRPNSPNGLAVMVQYESGDFDIISSNFTASYQANGRFESYVMSWWNFEDIIQRYFETDVSWFLRRSSPSVDDFSDIMASVGFNLVDYTEDMEDVGEVRRKLRGYFPPNHSEYGKYIEFVRFWGPVLAMEGFDERIAEIWNNIGEDSFNIREQVSNRIVVHFLYNENIYYIKLVSDVMVVVGPINQEYDQWTRELLEHLFPIHGLIEDNVND